MPGIVQLSILWMPLCVRRVVASSRPDPPSSSLNASARFAELVALRRRSRWGAKAVLSARATRRPEDPSSHSPPCCRLSPRWSYPRMQATVDRHPKIRAALGSRSLNRFLKATRLEPTANR
jgi:hypothetical protein